MRNLKVFLHNKQENFTHTGDQNKKKNCMWSKSFVVSLRHNLNDHKFRQDTPAYFFPDDESLERCLEFWNITWHCIGNWKSFRTKNYTYINLSQNTCFGGWIFRVVLDEYEIHNKKRRTPLYTVLKQIAPMCIFITKNNSSDRQPGDYYTTSKNWSGFNRRRVLSVHPVRHCSHLSSLDIT